MNYAGDISPKEAWEILAKEPGAVLVDVRTRPEWAFVGIPDLGNLGKKTVLLSWQNYPEMAVEQDFAGKLKAQIGEAAMSPTGGPVLFICRSGARSRYTWRIPENPEMPAAASVLIAPAEIAFTRMFFGPRSLAR